jgi:hypothetical protein
MNVFKKPVVRKEDKERSRGECKKHFERCVRCRRHGFKQLFHYGADDGVPASSFGHMRALSAVKKQQTQHGNGKKEAVSRSQDGRGGKEPVGGNAGRGDYQDDARETGNFIGHGALNTFF